MKISVVIPAFNCGLSIGRCLDSVLAQTRSADEIVIIDDGSSDNTAEICADYSKQYAQIKYYYQDNAGVAEARNKGIDLVTSKWVAFLDSDDAWLPEKLAVQASFIDDNPEIAWIAGAFQKVKLLNDKYLDAGAVSTMPGSELVAVSMCNALQLLAGEIQIWTGTVMMRRETVQSLGGFPTGWQVAEDLDLWVRFAIQEPMIGYACKPIAVYTVDQPSSLTGSASDSISPAKLKFFRRLADQIENLQADEKQLCEKIFDRYAGQYAFNLARTGNYKASKEFVNWFRTNGFRVPGWRYRWIHLVPFRLVHWLRTLMRNFRSTSCFLLY